MIRVNAVQPESLGEELGLAVGTELLTVNGRALEDFLDWEFLTADDAFTLHVRQPDGQEIEFDIERPEGLPMGLGLEPPRIRRCANRCDFCFVDGLPTGLRETLYIRDDDYRLSFRYGNFATLTNLKQRDIDRIIEYRLSPLYVSVHATDPTVRRWLLRNPTAPDILEQLRGFAEHGIQFHTQIVMSPGVNDGAVLERSLNDLYAFGESVLSVSVVPVGLTEYSKHHLVREPTEAECAAAVRLVERHAAVARDVERQAPRSDTEPAPVLGTDPASCGSAEPGIEYGYGRSWVEIADELAIRVVTGPYFLATKLEAFYHRGNGDIMASHDMEDMITLIDGRPELVEEVRSAAEEVKGFLSRSFRAFLGDRLFLEALPGHLLPDSASQRRVPLLMERIREMAETL